MLAVEERVHKIEDQYDGFEHRVSGSEGQLNKVTSQLHWARKPTGPSRTPGQPGWDTPG